MDPPEPKENAPTALPGEEQNDTFVSPVDTVTQESEVVPRGGELQVYVIVPLYVIIFILSVVGNSLVLITLRKRNKIKFSVTNTYLINLAASDLLLGVFCMPFTLIGQVLRNFIFGKFLCSVIPFFQAISVSVGVWTLVLISLERYYAICRPLASRRWQTQGHACKMVFIIWLISCLWTSPIAFVSRLQPLSEGRHKCREVWPNDISEKIYSIFLDIVLLLIPLVIMIFSYCLIVGKLLRGIQNEKRLCRGEYPEDFGGGDYHVGRQGRCFRRSTLRTWLIKIRLAREDPPSSEIPLSEFPPMAGEVITNAPRTTPRRRYSDQAVRSNYIEKSICAKKRLIPMTFIVVAEFFICWAPLHILNTWYLFSPDEVYNFVGANGISLVQLLAYVSSCCNPITYCFMNKKFRQSFVSVFTCCLSCARRCGEGDIDERPTAVRVVVAREMPRNEVATADTRVLEPPEPVGIDIDDSDDEDFV